MTLLQSCEAGQALLPGVLLCSGPEALAVALPSRLSSAPAVLNVLPDRVHIDHLLFGIEIDQVDLFKQECDLMLSTVVYCVLKKSPFGIFQS